MTKGEAGHNFYRPATYVMAKHNSVFLYGQVIKDPTIVKNSAGELIRAVAPIIVIRGIRDYGNNEIKHMNYDKPYIITGDPAQIEKISKWKAGNMVEVKGSVTTQDINKVSFCSHCNAKNINKGTTTFINPIYTSVREKKQLTPEQGASLLKEHCEISNQVLLVGMLCRDVVGFNYAEKNTLIANYQLAVSRKYHIKNDASNNRIDFPWVKTYGKYAEKDLTYLKRGSYVLVDGMLVTRRVKRKQVCCECGEEYTWEETVMDIISYATEYLKDCKTPDEVQKEEAENRQKAIKEIFSEEEIPESGNPCVNIEDSEFKKLV